MLTVLGKRENKEKNVRVTPRIQKTRTTNIFNLDKKESQKANNDFMLPPHYISSFLSVK